MGCDVAGAGTGWCLGVPGSGWVGGVTEEWFKHGGRVGEGFLALTVES